MVLHTRAAGTHILYLLSTSLMSLYQPSFRRRNFAYKRIEQWSLDLVPDNIRDGVQISVQEVECGDPNCSPIDTAVAIMFTG